MTTSTTAALIKAARELLPSCAFEDTFEQRVLRQALDAIEAQQQPTGGGEMLCNLSRVWRDAKPSLLAQKIRSQVAHEVDIEDIIPDYVWDIVDVAVERALSPTQPPAPQAERVDVERLAEIAYYARNPAMKMPLAPWHEQDDFTKDYFRRIVTTLLAALQPSQPDYQRAYEVLMDYAKTELDCSPSAMTRKSAAKALARADAILREPQSIAQWGMHECE